MVSLVYTLLRSGASGRDPLSPGREERRSERRAIAAEVSSASPEVERARDATHSAIALRSAETGGKT
jgi:hypothetical protein